MKPIQRHFDSAAAFSRLARTVSGAIVAHHPVDLFFDNDGTLFPFNLDPGAVTMDRACFEGLLRLTRFPNVRAVSLTGRAARAAASDMLTPGYEVFDSRGELLNAQGDKTLRFAVIGSHGTEYLDRDGTHIGHDFGPAATAFIRRFQTGIGHLRALYPGITVEDSKHGAVGVNVGTIPGAAARKAEAFDAALGLFLAYEGAPDNPLVDGRPLFRLYREGAREMELRASGFGKAFGIRRFGLPAVGGAKSDALTLFMGDSFRDPDGTDIEAARLIKDRTTFTQGYVLQIRNGRCGPTALADMSLDNPAMLGRFLCDVAARVEKLAFRTCPLPPVSPS